MIETFVTPPTEVEATQYTGEESIDEIFHWLGGLFVVRAGADHELRHVSELTEEGRVLNEAPPFLVIRTRSGDDRVDLGSWIVRFDEERVSVYDELSFAFHYVKKGE